jgi:glycosyltransferase involved in cell wall biosynthesis
VRVLISAYACTPGDGSEPGAGWTWARAAAQRHEVWLLTRKNNGPAIGRALAAEPHLAIHPVYLDLPAWARWWKRGSRGVRWYALFWQVLAWRTAKQIHASERLDVTHHVTFASDWLPAGVAWLAGVPCIWGPVGGATRAPLRTWRWLGWRGATEDLARLLVGAVGRSVLGRATARRAALVVAQNADTLRAFPSRRSVLEPNVAVDPTLAPGGEDIPAQDGPIMLRGQAVRAIFIGRLVPWKGTRLAIEALQHLPPRSTLDIYGDGPDLARCRGAADELGLATRVRFHGRRTREEVLAALESADVLLHPSLHDSAPWSVGEALVAKVPVIALALGGPKELLAGGGGVAVSPYGDLPRALAAAATAALTSAPSSRDWTFERLPGLLDAWYRSVADPERTSADTRGTRPFVRTTGC